MWCSILEVRRRGGGLFRLPEALAKVMCLMTRSRLRLLVRTVSIFGHFQVCIADP